MMAARTRPALSRNETFNRERLHDLHAVLRHNRPFDLERGQVLFLQGDPARSCYLILEGRLKLYRQRIDGVQAIVSILDAGTVYFEPTMLFGGRHKLCGEAASAIRIGRIGIDALRQAIHNRPDLLLELLRFAALYIDHLVDQVETLKVLSVPQRVAEFLVRGAETTIGSATIKLPYEKCLLANHLGTTPESLSRALCILRKLGVAVVQDRIQIESVERLVDYIGKPATVQ